MPDQITTANVQEYKANVQLLMQQKGEVFRGKVTSDSYVGKQASVVEQFGETEAQERNTRHADTPVIDVPQAKRWVTPKDYEWASLIDHQDKLRMVIDPTSPYAASGAAAMNRKRDDAVITAFFASAKTGEDGDGSESFDTTNYRVAVTVGGAASSLNIAKLQEAQRMFLTANEEELDEMLYCAIGPYENKALLQELQVTSADFNGGEPVLKNGKITNFMGYEFCFTNRLNISSGNRLIPAWRPSGMHLGIWQEFDARVSERADKSYAWQVYLCGTYGATRLEQGKVVQILCDDQI